jgi:hypothetical protein
MRIEDPTYTRSKCPDSMRRYTVLREVDSTFWTSLILMSVVTVFTALHRVLCVMKMMLAHVLDKPAETPRHTRLAVPSAPNR